MFVLFGDMRVNFNNVKNYSVKSIEDVWCVKIDLVGGGGADFIFNDSRKNAEKACALIDAELRNGSRFLDLNTWLEKEGN